MHQTELGTLMHVEFNEPPNAVVLCFDLYSRRVQSALLGRGTSDDGIPSASGQGGFQKAFLYLQHPRRPR